MKWREKLTAYKKCPRCGNKCLKAQEKCEECGLLFSRMQYASNKAAKKKILHFDKDYVIYTNQYPKDVSWWKLLLYTLLFGLVGGHYYYVGKYIKGGLMTTGFVYLIFCTVFNTQIYSSLESGAYLPIGILAFSWIVSLVYVCSKKFKVPVIVDMQEDSTENYRRDMQATVKEISQENKKLQKETSLKDKTNQNLKNKNETKNKVEDKGKKETNKGGKKTKRDSEAKK